ncbi:MAG: DinB family protein [Thermoanaerobaculia bacterium]
MKAGLRIAGAHRELARLAAQFDALDRMVRFDPKLLDLRVPRVSRWSIGQQVDHILRVLERGVEVFGGRREPLPKKINLLGRLILSLDWIPRGLGKSPRSVVPAEAPAAADLGERLSLLRERYVVRRFPDEVLSNEEPFFPHPFFRGLCASESLRFLATHTRHHLKIIADIRRGARFGDAVAG